MKVSWFSAGISSALATKMALEIYPELVINYIHIDNQHSDTLRFVYDCEKWFEKKINILQSPYKNIETVIATFKYINGVAGARCTQILKKRVRKEYELDNKILVYVWGFDCSKREIARANRLKSSMPEFQHVFPLIDNKITKEKAHALFQKSGIKRPEMYELGYPNNNCVGCVKGGMGYWNKIRKDFPDVFKRMSDLESTIGATCINGVSLNKLNLDQGNKLKPIVPDCGIYCEGLND